MNRREIKSNLNRCAALILYFSTRGNAVKILKAIGFFLFHDDSFTRGQPPISVTCHWRNLSYVDTKHAMAMTEGQTERPTK